MSIVRLVTRALVFLAPGVVLAQDSRTRNGPLRCCRATTDVVHRARARAERNSRDLDRAGRRPANRLGARIRLGGFERRTCARPPPPCIASAPSPNCSPTSASCVSSSSARSISTRPIQRYLPDFHPKNPFGGTITIRELTVAPRRSHARTAGRQLLRRRLTAPTLAGDRREPQRHDARLQAGHAHEILERRHRRARLRARDERSSESFYPYLERAVLAADGTGAQRVSAAAGDRRESRQGTCGRSTAAQFDGADLSARHGTVRQHVQHRARPRPISSRCCSRAARRRTASACSRRRYARLDVDAAIRRAGAKTGFGIGFNIGQLDGHRTDWTRRRDLWICHRTARAPRRLDSASW